MIQPSQEMLIQLLFRERELIYRRNADNPRFYGTSERYLVFGWCLNICNDIARNSIKANLDDYRGNHKHEQKVHFVQ